MRKLVALTIGMLVMLGGTSTAHAHLVVRPKSDSLTDIAASQKVNLAHAKFVCRKGKRSHKRWSCHASRGWLKTEYHQTLAKLQPPVAYGAPLCGSSCIWCESKGDPGAWNGDDYWGLYQFDLGTWTRHGGSASEWGSAPSWRQHQVAQRVKYDAWPNC